MGDVSFKDVRPALWLPCLLTTATRANGRSDDERARRISAKERGKDSVRRLRADWKIAQAQDGVRLEAGWISANRLS